MAQFLLLVYFPYCWWKKPFTRQNTYYSHPLQGFYTFEVASQICSISTVSTTTIAGWIVAITPPYFAADLVDIIAPYLEDHPRTCKWLGSPPFIRHKKAIRKGSHNPTSLGDLQIIIINHWTKSWEPILQVVNTTFSEWRAAATKPLADIPLYWLVNEGILILILAYEIMPIYLGGIILYNPLYKTNPRKKNKNNQPRFWTLLTWAMFFHLVPNFLPAFWVAWSTWPPLHGGVHVPDWLSPWDLPRIWSKTTGIVLWFSQDFDSLQLTPRKFNIDIWNSHVWKEIHFPNHRWYLYWLSRM